MFKRKKETFYYAGLEVPALTPMDRYKCLDDVTKGVLKKASWRIGVIMVVFALCFSAIIGRLFYLGKYEQAKVLLEKTLVYYPSNIKLLELENQCECFITRNIGNYIKMLSVRTFLTDDESERFKTEIDGFCKMVGNKAIYSLNIPMQRKQNTENYEAILKYIVDLKKCLRNDAVIHSDKLYETIRTAVLKLSAIVCNTIYIKNTRLPRQYIMLIDFKYRRQLKADFDAIDLFGETEYKIVDESVIRQYISGGRYE